jgi:hypothetical protein
MDDDRILAPGHALLYQALLPLFFSSTSPQNMVPMVPVAGLTDVSGSGLLLVIGSLHN